MSKYSTYKNTYDECRNAFHLATKEIKASRVTFESIQVSNTYENLFTDVTHIKNCGENPLVIIISGLHGIEGYVGSAMQTFLLNQINAKQIDSTGLDLLFIHAVNPWGFKNNRRVTSNNVDLNRNFSQTEEIFKIKNTGYTAMKEILQPDKKYSRWTFGNITFLVKIVKSIARYSKSTLIQAIGEGQYEYKKGIIYGGKSFEEENKNITKILKKYCKPYENILVIDIHTGLGKRGKLQLLNAPKIPKEVKIKVNELFDYKVVNDEDENFFKEHGSFLDFVWNINKEKNCLPIMFEFGTINSENILGALRTLKTMIIENQTFHNGFKSYQDKKYIDQTFLEMFYPSDTKWRNEVMNQFKEIIQHVLRKFKN